MSERIEKIEIESANGSVKITRTQTKATIEKTRRCFGFYEKETIVVEKLDNTCSHFAFLTKPELIDIFKSH